jgi:hypothetical protein
MSSIGRGEPLDLERGLKTTPGDVAALRAARELRPMSGPEYLVFLSQFNVAPEVLRARRGPHGEPFRL